MISFPFHFGCKRDTWWVFFFFSTLIGGKSLEKMQESHYYWSLTFYQSPNTWCLWIQRQWKGRALLGVRNFPFHPYFEKKLREDVNLKCVCGDVLKSMGASYRLPAHSVEVHWVQGKAKAKLCQGSPPPASFPTTAVRTTLSSFLLWCLGLHSPGLDSSFRSLGLYPVSFRMCSLASNCVQKRKNVVVTCSYCELFLLHQLPVYSSQVTKYWLLTH